MVAVKAATSAQPGDGPGATTPHRLPRPPTGTRLSTATDQSQAPCLAAGADAAATVTWRDGTKTRPANPTAVMSSQFLVLRLRPANRNIPRNDDGSLTQRWLIAQWPTSAPEPTDYRLSTLTPGVAVA